MKSYLSTELESKLKQEANTLRELHLRELLAPGSGRFEKMSLRVDDFFLDYSKNLLRGETLDLLLKLANESGLKDQIEKMFTGEKINWTENRAVLHTALRSRDESLLEVDGLNVREAVSAVLQKMEAFCAEVHEGRILSSTGKKFDTVVNIGIGGSDLGPKMVVEALDHYGCGINVHFASNVDGTHVAQTLKKCNPETTLFLVASKTFTTQETMTNGHSARDWLIENLGEKAVQDHFVAMSTNIEEVTRFGIREERIFEFWDFVGGRYSLWSAIGLPIALFLGFERFRELLDGAYAMDEHFRNAEFDQSLPVLLALIGLWYNNFMDAQSYAILPYDQYLHRFAAHFQQVDMESNGKSVNCDNEPVDYETGPILWGEPGTNGQHAFYQLIHQGSKLIPCDFIGFVESLNPLSDHHNKLMANYFAQTEALAMGLTEDEVRVQLKSEGKSEDEINTLLNHKVFSGNRPTNSLLIDKLSPASLGKLVALYEHKVFVQGILWRLNSFDQWGVELGKKLAKSILSEIESGKARDHDESTTGLLTEFLNRSKN